MAVAIARPAVATTVGRPRRSAAASSTSSCTSVAEWISSTATIARSTRSGCAGDGPAASSTSSGRSRLPPAAIVALACSASTGPCELRELLQAVLELVHQSRHVRAPAAITAATASALAMVIPAVDPAEFGADAPPWLARTQGGCNGGSLAPTEDAARRGGAPPRTGRVRGRDHSTVPECSAMMPPAVRIQRTSVSPAPAIAAPSSSGPGSA